MHVFCSTLIQLFQFEIPRYQSVVCTQCHLPEEKLQTVSWDLWLPPPNPWHAASAGKRWQWRSWYKAWWPIPRGGDFQILGCESIQSFAWPMGIVATRHLQTKIENIWKIEDMSGGRNLMTIPFYSYTPFAKPFAILSPPPFLLSRKHPGIIIFRGTFAGKVVWICLVSHVELSFAFYYRPIYLI